MSTRAASGELTTNLGENEYLERALEPAIGVSWIGPKNDAAPRRATTETRQPKDTAQ